jgi:hypothetical protein
MNFTRLAMLVLLAATAVAADSVPQISGTQIKLFTPYGPSGLSKTLSVSQTLSGSCFAESVADASRSDAWRCNAGNAIEDPCFANLMGDGKTIACARSPWEGKIVLLTLDSPLPAAGRKTIPRESAMPWTLELANGDRCALFTGATAPVAGMRIHYGCPGGGQVVGDPDKSHPVWRVFYQKEGAASLDQVDVIVAWY